MTGFPDDPAEGSAGHGGQAPREPRQPGNGGAGKPAGPGGGRSPDPSGGIGGGRGSSGEPDGPGEDGGPSGTGRSAGQGFDAVDGTGRPREGGTDGSPGPDGLGSFGRGGGGDGGFGAPFGLPGGAADDGYDGAGDPLERVLRPRPGYLAAPPGAFERIRGRAARRRRLRAAAGGVAALAVVTGSLYAAGVLAPRDGGREVGPPANSTQASTSPGPTRTSGTLAPSVTASPHTPDRQGSGSAGAVAGEQGSSAPATGGTRTPSSPSAGGTAMCTAGQLSVALGGGDAGAGNLYRYLVVTNTGTAACQVDGFPGLSLLDANGKQIGQPATRRPLAHSPVVLRPGASASDTIHTANQQGTCETPSTRLRIYPPGSRQSLTFPGSITICDGLFEITPFIAGRTGNPPA
jgi:hypothetical protein